MRIQNYLAATLALAAAGFMSSSAQSLGWEDLSTAEQAAYSWTRETGCPQYPNRICVGDWVIVDNEIKLIISTGQGGSVILDPKNETKTSISNQQISAKATSFRLRGNIIGAKVTEGPHYGKYGYVHMKFSKKGQITKVLFSDDRPAYAERIIKYGILEDPRNLTDAYLGPVL